MDMGGSTIKIAPVGLCGEVRLSPDRKWIAFVSHGEGSETHISLLDIKRERYGKLTHTGTDYSPVWSPDGKKIFFVSGRHEKKDGNTEIYVMDHDGSNQQNLSNDYEPRYDHSLTLSPDGKKIAFVSDWKLAIMNADGTGRKDFPYHVHDPTWFPDGKKILFDCSENPQNQVLCITDINGVMLRKIPYGLEDYRSLSVSPDGKRIAFFWAQNHEKNGETYVMDINGRNKKNLTNHPAWDVGPQWTPDGRILFTSNRGRGDDLYIISPDGTGLKNLTLGRAAVSLGWVDVK